MLVSLLAFSRGALSNTKERGMAQQSHDFTSHNKGYVQHAIGESVALRRRQSVGVSCFDVATGSSLQLRARSAESPS